MQQLGHACTQRSDGYLPDSVLFSHHVGPEVWTWILRFGRKYFYLLSCLKSRTLVPFTWNVNLIFAGVMAFTISDYATSPDIAFLLTVSSLLTKHASLTWWTIFLNQCQGRAEPREPGPEFQKRWERKPALPSSLPPCFHKHDFILWFPHQENGNSS